MFTAKNEKIGLILNFCNLNAKFKDNYAIYSNALRLSDADIKFTKKV